MGPDNISPIMLKHLGPQGIRYLTNIYNHSVNKSIVPMVWKTGRIIPLLKPGKESNKGPSHRPISLLSPSAKILESILKPTIEESMELKDHQHGFRKGRSTTTALQQISDHITNGLNMKKPVNRTVLVAIDLSKAFDTVNHEILLNDIMELPLNDRIKRFLFAYLRGRQTYVEFRGKKSKFRVMKQGVPQGGVLSPLLFNLYMRNMPQPPPHVSVKTYADDTTILSSHKDYKVICERINPYLSILENWFKERCLIISPSKSTATLFSTFGNEMNLELPIHINGDKIPTVKKPKILGVTLDTTFSFKHHADNLKQKMSTKNNILKALAGSTWGQEKETILTSYKAIGLSNANYCASIWTPNLKQTNWNNLQTAQNSALRIATGCVKKTPIQHLHNETKIMPIKEHCEMISKQFLLATQRENHPNYKDLSTPAYERPMKGTLHSRFGNEIINKTHNQRLNEDSYKRFLKEIHTDEVRKTILNQQNNILQAVPPEINQEEKTLPRKTRCTLSQLRSGYSPYLKSYLHSINASDSDMCPNCNAAPHTTEHLFNCGARPTNLTKLSLWTSPRACATFLGLDIEEPG